MNSSFVRRFCSWRDVDRITLHQHLINSLLGRVPSSTATTDGLFQTYNNTLCSIANRLGPERTFKCRLWPLCRWSTPSAEPSVGTVVVLNVTTDELLIRLNSMPTSPPVLTNTIVSTRRRATGRSTFRLMAVHQRSSGGCWQHCCSETNKWLTSSHPHATTLWLLAVLRQESEGCLCISRRSTAAHIYYIWPVSNLTFVSKLVDLVSSVTLTHMVWCYSYSQRTDVITTPSQHCWKCCLTSVLQSTVKWCC